MTKNLTVDETTCKNLEDFSKHPLLSVKAKERDKPQPIDYGVGYESAAPRWRNDPVSSNGNRTNTHAVL